MAVTYRNLYDAVLKRIQEQCLNVMNYDNVPSEMRAGATFSSRFQGTAKSYIQYVRVTWTIDNPIPSASQAEVKSGLDALMTKYNLTSMLDKEVTSRGLLKFFHVVALFAAAKVKIAASQFTDSKSVVYIKDGSVSEVSGMLNVPEENKITAIDLNTLTQTIIEIISANTKGHLVTYTEKLSVE